MSPLSASRPALRTAPGFSLIEVTLAIGIIAFAVVALVGLMGIIQQRSTESENRTRLLGAFSVLETTVRTEANPAQLLADKPGYFLSRDGELLRVDKPYPAPGKAAPANAYYLGTVEDATPAGLSTPRRIVRVRLRYPLPREAFSAELLVSTYPQ